MAFNSAGQASLNGFLESTYKLRDGCPNGRGTYLTAEEALEVATSKIAALAEKVRADLQVGCLSTSRSDKIFVSGV